MNVEAVDLMTVIVLVYLTIVGPVLTRILMSRFRRDVSEGRTDARLWIYRLTVLIQWCELACFLALWLVLGRSLQSIGLGLPAMGWRWLAAAAVLAATAVLAVMSLRASRDPEAISKAGSYPAAVAEFIPKTPAEEKSFVRLSVTAGICEEVIYRGILLTILSAIIGTWPAVVVSSLIFGLAHAYQGANGVFRTTLVGLAFALVVLATGTLYVAIILHVVLDITQGRLMAAMVRIEAHGAPPVPDQATATT